MIATWRMVRRNDEVPCAGAGVSVSDGLPRDAAEESRKQAFENTHVVEKQEERKTKQANELTNLNGYIASTFLRVG